MHDGRQGSYGGEPLDDPRNRRLSATKRRVILLQKTARVLTHDYVD